MKRDELRRLLDDRDAREEWLGDEPSRLFSLLGADEIPAERLEALQADVEQAIAPRPSTARWWAAAAVLATVALGGWLALRDVEPAATEVALTPPPASPELGPVRGIELLASPGEAQVVDFSVGDTQIVMIFDEALDL